MSNELDACWAELIAALPQTHLPPFPNMEGGGLEFNGWGITVHRFPSPSKFRNAEHDDTGTQWQMWAQPAIDSGPHNQIDVRSNTQEEGLRELARLLRLVTRDGYDWNIPIRFSKVYA